MLEQLPRELLDIILCEISFRDVKSLSVVSKQLHSVTLHIIWRSVLVKAWSKKDIYGIHVDGFPLENISYIRNIDLRFITERDTRRCSHNRRLQTSFDFEESDESIADEEASFRMFNERIYPLLNECTDNQLNSFSWDLGACVPSTLLGTHGIVTRRQSKLSTLKLATHPFCERYSSLEHKIDLSAFRQLHHLQWRGLNSDNLEALSSALENNKDHLETLEINLAHWKSLRQALGYQSDSQRINGIRARDYIEKVVFGLNKNSLGVVFTSLHTLALERVALTEALARALNFEILRSLTIRLCPQWFEFIQAINRLKIHPKLKKLEVQEAWPRHEGISVLGEHDPILPLLEAIEDLEELYIGQSGEGDSANPWEYANWSGSTLKRYVNHARTWHESVGWTDTDNEWYAEDDADQYKFGCLEFIGISCAPSDLEDIFRPFDRRDCVKVIHLRQSIKYRYGDDSWACRKELEMSPGWETMLVDGPGVLPRECLVRYFYWFLQWAFGADGIRSLQYVVYGDFSRLERYNRENLLVCRAEAGNEDFRVIRETSGGPEWEHVKEEYGEAMSCCPLDPLFEVPG